MRATLLLTTALLSAVTASAQSADQGMLEEIIVTAQRRSENLQKVAVAVSAIGAADLVNAGVTEAASLTRLVPALVVQPAGGSNTGFYLRGVGSLGPNSFAENAIAFNYGGVYIGRPTAPVGAFFDLARVEVVKGPQGTLYGRNATGGAVNVIPNRPDNGGTKGEVGLEIGNYQHRKLTGMLNAPVSDTLTLRIAGQLVDRDGYLSDGYDDEEGEAGRASLLWEPVERVSLLLTGDYYHQGGKGVGSVLVPGSLTPTAPAVGDRIGGSEAASIAELRTRFAGLVNSGLVVPPEDDGFIDSEFWGVSATLDYSFDAGTLTVLPAYRDSRPDFVMYSPGFQGTVQEVSKQSSLEVRFASDDAQAFRYVLGGFWFKDKMDAYNSFFQGGLSTTTFMPNLETTSKAVFGQGTYDLQPGFRLVAGVRYTHENKQQATPVRQSSAANPNPPYLLATGDENFESVTWKGGVEFDAGPQSLLYANVATGFKAGGFFAAVRNNSFDPEKLTAYTVGSKNRFLDNRLQLNAEAFWWDYKDQQVGYIGPVETAPGVFTQAAVTANVGQARMVGAEIEAQFRPTPADEFGVNLQYMDTKYNSFVYTAISAAGAPLPSGCSVTPNTSLPVAAPARLFTIDCSGKPAVNAPKWSLNLTYSHSFTLSPDHDLVLGARSRIESGRFLSIDYRPEQHQGGYMTSDAWLTLDAPGQGWSLTAFVNNIEDKDIYSTSFTRPILNVVYNGLRPPRTYGLRGSVSF
ncbi:TonB-dependent receptor [Niveispirillum sp. KHB5.9]|uniref:TonB-dependent receptor n=1 Tax=Niveispirillum sp. KHB5.9 TaxID=3400269 RepID=UPI003A8C0ED0